MLQSKTALVPKFTAGAIISVVKKNEREKINVSDHLGWSAGILRIAALSKSTYLFPDKPHSFSGGQILVWIELQKGEMPDAYAGPLTLPAFTFLVLEYHLGQDLSSPASSWSIYFSSLPSFDHKKQSSKFWHVVCRMTLTDLMVMVLPQYQADNISHRDGKYHLYRPEYLWILNYHHLHFYDRLMNDIHLHSYNRLIDLWTDDPDGADGNDLRQTRKPQELPGKFRHSQFIFVSLLSMSLSLSCKLYLRKIVTKGVV